MSDLADEPDHVAEAESLSLTCLMALEELLPVERAAFLLHHLFGRSHAETARAVGVSDAACRQLLGRGRRVMTAARPRLDAERRERKDVTRRFAAALRAGDQLGLAELLAPDVVAHMSAEQLTIGRRNVAQLLDRLTRDLAPDQLAISIEVSGGLVQTVRRRNASATRSP